MEQLIAALPDLMSILGGKIASIPEFLLLVGKYANLYVGVFMPLLVGIIVRDVSNKDYPIEIKGFRLFSINLRFAITVGLCTLMAAALNIKTVLSMGWSSLDQIIALGTYIFTQSQIVFYTWFKDSDLRQSLERKPIAKVEAQSN
jgi:hypothetical protein